MLPLPPRPARRHLPVLASCMLTASAAETPSWTGWRGPARDAQIKHFSPPAKWPEQLDKVWRVEVGEGYSTPLVTGDRIYQHARQRGEEVLWCLDRQTGKPIWRRATAIDFEAGAGGERHGLGPKSTPTVADGRVFTLSITGVLAAWSADDGNPLWRRDFRERFEVSHPYWGTATSPIVDGERLFVHTGSCEKGALFCIDTATGKDLWVRDEDANCYSSPLIETIDGVRQIVEFNHSGLCGIDLDSGSLLWKHPFPHRGNNQNTPTPLRYRDLWIVGGENRGMFCVRPRKIDGNWPVEEVWRHRNVSIDMNSPVVNDGLVYGFSHLKMGRIFCLDPNTGEVLWEGEPRAGENGHFLSLPGHVLALTDDGSLRVLRANRQAFDAIRTYQIAQDGTWAAPALVGDALLIKERNHLSMLRLPDRTETGGPKQPEK